MTPPPMEGQKGQILDGEAAGNEFGSSVSLSADGDRVAVGAPFNNDGGAASGSVRVFELSGTTWTQLGGDIDGEAADDQFGFSVSLSADGTRVAGGAPFNDGGGGSSAGRIRVFEFVNGNWTQVCADIDGESGNDEYGYAVALSDDGVCLAGGAPNNGNGGIEAGQVRAYTCPR